jgi:hypothetical protein
MSISSPGATPDLQPYIDGCLPFDLVGDIETSGLRHAGMAIHCIEAAVLPPAGIDPFLVHGADKPGYTAMADMKLLIEAARKIVGHNVKVFDLPALRRVMGVVVQPDRIVDTLIASRVLCSDRRELDVHQHPGMPAKLIGRHSLDSWGYRLGIAKDAYEHWQDQPWSIALQEHCANDCLISWSLYLHLLEIDAEALA